MPSRHCKYSPSSADRWLNCTSSIKHNEQFKNKNTKYTDEGHFAHELAAWMLTHEGDRPESLNYDTYELKLYIQKYINYIKEVQKHSEIMLIEKEVMIPNIMGFGTIDCVIISPPTLHIIDLKYGAGKAVKVTNNPQLKLYALGALDTMSVVYNLSRIQMHIVQPRSPNKKKINSSLLEAEDLIKWGNKVKKKVNDIEADKNTEFKAGEWCWFCPGKNYCPLILEKDFKEVAVDE